MLRTKETQYDYDIFSSEEKYLDFLLECTRQFCILKFGNKKKINSQIKSNLGINIPKNATYKQIISRLEKNSRNFHKDIIGKSSKEEVASLYSFYKMLKDVFWETTWAKMLSPLYIELYGKEPKIRSKSDQLKYCKEIILDSDEESITKKWINLIQKLTLVYPPTIHYKHLTLGPLGLKFSLYPRGKTVFGFPRPIFNILMRSAFDINNTDFNRVFSFILKNLEKKIDKVPDEYPAYYKYLGSINMSQEELLSIISEYRQNLLKIVKRFQRGLKEDKILMFFFILSQLSAMFYRDEEVLGLLNELIAEGSLVIKQECDLERRIKVTEYGIVKRPPSWISKPAFELAEDIARAETGKKEYDTERFREILGRILDLDPPNYLKKLCSENLNLFKQLLRNKRIYALQESEKYEIPIDKVVRILLEAYGVVLPSNIPFAVRKDLKEHLSELKKFKQQHKELNETVLLRKTRHLLQESRTHFERFFKEFFFLLSILIISYKELESKTPERRFLLNRPLQAPSVYDREKSIIRIKKKFRDHLEKISQYLGLNDVEKIREYLKNGRARFALGDWYNLIKASLRYIKNEDGLGKEFWLALPKSFRDETREVTRGLEEFFQKESVISTLNLASHEKSMKELRSNIEKRKKAISTTLILDKKLKELFGYLPDSVKIKEVTSEVETGLTSYVAEYVNLEGETEEMKVYGTRIYNTSFTYFVIPLFPEEKFAYPILVTNLVDIFF